MLWGQAVVVRSEFDVTKSYLTCLDSVLVITIMFLIRISALTQDALIWSLAYTVRGAPGEPVAKPVMPVSLF